MDGILLPKRSIGYKHIPKTACTSIKHALYKLRTGKEFSRKEVGMHVHQFFEKRYSDLSEARFKFIVIRDPIKRFLSAYSNRVTYHKELSRSFLEKRVDGKQLIEKENIPIDPSLSDFITYLSDYETIGVIRHHIKPVTEFFDEELTYFDKVYKMEELKELSSDISRMYNVKFRLPRKQTGGKKFSISNLSKIEMEFLMDYYAKDYLLMSDYYTQDMIWRDWKLERETI